VVVYTCNSSYSAGRDWENLHLRPARVKVSETPISINKLGVVVHFCNPSYVRGIDMAIKI
jgi:hypothetical protein